MELQHILAGVTFRPGTHELTEGSRKAALQAAWVARRARRPGGGPGRLILLHSTHPDERSGSGPGREAPEGLDEGAQAVLEDLRAELTNGEAECEVLVAAGKAWRELARRAIDRRVDLVVCGKRNERAEDGPRCGNVATEVLRNAPCPVWVVRPEHDQTYRLILAATDLSSVSERACRAAAWLAAEHQAELHLLHAYAVPALDDIDPGVDEAAQRERRAEELADVRDRARRKLLASVSGRRLAHEPTVHLVKGPPSRAIAEAVEHLGPDLLVMGSTSHGGTPGHLLGDTAERTLSRVRCSTLTFKPSDFLSPLA